METEQDSMEEEDMEIDHLENTDSNQQENIEIDQENSENTQPEKPVLLTACSFLVPFNVFTLVSGQSLLIPLTNINCRFETVFSSPSV
jgi:hypothetical protein